MSKSKKILIILILAIGAIFLYSIMNKENASEISYREDKVERGDIAINILATGTVQPENRLEIKPPISGRIEKVLVEEGDKVHKGQVLAWMSSLERAALLDAAREKGPREIKKWEEIYLPTPVLAPIDGTIILREVQQGETFTNSEPLLVMSDRLTVKAQVDETDIASIQLKQGAQIILDAYPDEKIPAIVDKIAFEATTVNNVTTYIVDVLPKRIPESMRSGMTANVNFVTKSKENVLLISVEALKSDNGKYTVLVKNSDGKRIEKTVSIGINNGKNVEILEGLNEGEIVLSPQIKFEGKGEGGSSSPFAPTRVRR